MLYEQWNYDEAVSVEREEAYEDGREAGKAIGIAIGIAEGRVEGMAEGKAEGIAEGIIEGERQIIYNFLEHLGKIPEDIRKSIEDEQDEDILKKWCMAAPGVKSFEEFRESMQATEK